MSKIPNKPMNTIIFDGKTEAENILKSVRQDVQGFANSNGRKPKLISIVAGDRMGNLKYSSLKQKAAESVGINFTLDKYPENVSINQIIDTIEKLNKDKLVDGVMVQLPLPVHFTKMDQDKVINSIDSKKDVDGMRNNSNFVAPVVLAVDHALKAAKPPPLKEPPLKVVVVGAKGFVGSKIVTKLRDAYEYEIIEVDIDTENLEELTKKADIVISAAGKPNIITETMVEGGVIAIDVGSPKRDFDESVYKKASFVTPVPGGIGPVTIAYLFFNLISTSR